jgi:hypothetical protein
MTRWSKERGSKSIEFSVSSEADFRGFSVGSATKKSLPFRLDSATRAPSVTEARKVLALVSPQVCNYFTNNKPGIWIFSRPDDHKIILSNCAEYGYPVPPKLSKPVSDTLTGIFLPQGGFVTYPYYGSIQFWQRQGISYDTRGMNEREHSNLGLFSVGVCRVVRIAGKSGTPDEVWQNPHYLADGALNPNFNTGDDLAALGRD